MAKRALKELAGRTEYCVHCFPPLQELYFLGEGRRCSGAGPVERSGWKLVHFGYSEKQIGSNLFASLYGHVPFPLISVDYCESTHPLP